METELTGYQTPVAPKPARKKPNTCYGKEDYFDYYGAWSHQAPEPQVFSITEAQTKTETEQERCNREPREEIGINPNIPKEINLTKLAQLTD